MKKTYEELATENRDLLMRLEETEEVLRAIRNQEVDALVVQGPEETRCLPSMERSNPTGFLLRK